MPPVSLFRSPLWSPRYEHRAVEPLIHACSLFRFPSGMACLREMTGMYLKWRAFVSRLGPKRRSIGAFSTHLFTHTGCDWTVVRRNWVVGRNIRKDASTQPGRKRTGYPQPAGELLLPLESTSPHVAGHGQNRGIPPRISTNLFRLYLSPPSWVIPHPSHLSLYPYICIFVERTFIMQQLCLVRLQT